MDLSREKLRRMRRSKRWREWQEVHWKQILVARKYTIGDTKQSKDTLTSCFSQSCGFNSPWLPLNLSFRSDLRRMKPLGSWSKLVCLYSSPQVKFYWNIVSYFAFLFLFAVVLMVDFQVRPSSGEILLYIWLATLVCEEVRQVREDGRDTVCI